MDIASRTPEGFPAKCPLCGKQNQVEPVAPMGDAVCAHCGFLLWPIDSDNGPAADDVIKRLHEIGLTFDTDDEGQITKLYVSGHRFNDKNLLILSGINGIPIVSISSTWISRVGFKLLQKLLPNSTIEYGLIRHQCTQSSN